MNTKPSHYRLEAAEGRIAYAHADYSYEQIKEYCKEEFASTVAIYYVNSEGNAEYCGTVQVVVS